MKEAHVRTAWHAVSGSASSGSGSFASCVRTFGILSLQSFLFLPPGGVIAYISSSSSASSPASCHSESSESSFQSSSSPVPSSPNSSTSESSCNSRSSEGSDGAPKNDQLDDAVKTSRSSAAGLTKGHGGLTSMYVLKYHQADKHALSCSTVSN